MADIFDRIAASNSAATPTPNQAGKTNIFDQFDPKTAVPVEEYSTAQLNLMDALSKDPNVPKDSEIGNRYILDQIAAKMLKDHLTAGQAWIQYQSQYLKQCNELGFIPDLDKDLKHLLSIDPVVPKSADLDDGIALSAVRFRMEHYHITAGKAWNDYQWERKVEKMENFALISVVVMAVLAALVAAVLLIRWVGRMIRTATNRGRYQIQNASSEGCYVLDTSTGEVTWKPRSNL